MTALKTLLLLGLGLSLSLGFTRYAPCQEGGYYPHPAYCGAYNQCLFGRVLLPRICSPGLVWNQELTTCDFIWRVDCKKRNLQDFNRLKELIKAEQDEILGVQKTTQSPAARAGTFQRLDKIKEITFSNERN